MPLVTWSFPTTIVFGEGALSTLAAHVKRIGGTRVLVVGDVGVRKAGVLERVTRELDRGGIASSVFDKVDANPVEQNVFDGVDAYRAAGATLIVSVGGGSPLDT